MTDLFLRRVGTGQEYKVTDRITIGRYRDNDIVLESKQVSRYHCTVNKDGNEIIVRDLNSSNGILINGKQVKDTQVSTGDNLQIGTEKFIFTTSEEKKEKRPGRQRFKSIIMDPFFRKKISGIKIISEKDPTQTYYFKSNSVHTIGRLSFCSIPINDLYVSRNNTTIEVREHHVAISDTNSKNGTYLNKKRILREELKEGDSINIAGRFNFTVSFEYESKKSLRTVKDVENFCFFDVLHELDTLHDLFKSKFNLQVLLEVERQAQIFCNELENVSSSKLKGTVLCDELKKFLRLLSGAQIIVDYGYQNSDESENDLSQAVSPEVLNHLESMLLQRFNHQILYFEAGFLEIPNDAEINGFLISFDKEFSLLLLGVPLENILYLVYASMWLSRIRSTI